MRRNPKTDLEKIYYQSRYWNITKCHNIIRTLIDKIHNLQQERDELSIALMNKH
jgi:hypothetical protein